MKCCYVCVYCLCSVIVCAWFAPVDAQHAFHQQETKKQAVHEREGEMPAWVHSLPSSWKAVNSEEQSEAILNANHFKRYTVSPVSEEPWITRDMLLKRYAAKWSIEPTKEGRLVFSREQFEQFQPQLAQYSVDAHSVTVRRTELLAKLEECSVSSVEAVQVFATEVFSKTQQAKMRGQHWYLFTSGYADEGVALLYLSEPQGSDESDEVEVWLRMFVPLQVEKGSKGAVKFRAPKPQIDFAYYLQEHILKRGLCPTEEEEQPHPVPGTKPQPHQTQKQEKGGAQ